MFIFSPKIYKMHKKKKKEAHIFVKYLMETGVAKIEIKWYNMLNTFDYVRCAHARARM